MSGRFITMMFGLIGACLAMYHTAKPENKKRVAGLLLSAALTSFLTGSPSQLSSPSCSWHPFSTSSTPSSTGWRL
jgi:hypothetical protein